MPVEPFTGWITSDRLLFTTKDEAETHQSLLDLRQFFKDAVGDGDTTTEEVIDAVWRHREIVRDFLNRALVPARMEEKI